MMADHDEETGDRFTALEAGLTQLARSIQILAYAQMATCAAVAAAIIWH